MLNVPPTPRHALPPRPLAQNCLTTGGRVIGSALVAGTLVISVVPPASADAGPVAGAGTTSSAASAASAASPAAARPVIHVVVVGDSYTSGEGAPFSTYKRVDVPSYSESEGWGTVSTISPAHQSTLAPAMQVIAALQAANPNVTIDAKLVAVSGAVMADLTKPYRPGTPFEQPAQLDAVRGADVVILGIGGNDAKFGEAVLSVLTSSEATSRQTLDRLTGPLRNETLDSGYQADQRAVVGTILGTMNPQGTLIMTNYPQVLPDTKPGNLWPSPVSSILFGDSDVTGANEFGHLISLRNEQVAALSMLDSPGPTVQFVDVSQAFAGHYLLSTNGEAVNGLDPLNPPGSYHPDVLGLTLGAAAQQDGITAAVKDQFGRLGVTIVDAPPIRPPDAAPAPAPAVGAPGAQTVDDLPATTVAQDTTGAPEAAGTNDAAPAPALAVGAPGAPTLEDLPATAPAPDTTAAPEAAGTPDTTGSPDAAPAPALAVGAPGAPTLEDLPAAPVPPAAVEATPVFDSVVASTGLTFSSASSDPAAATTAAPAAPTFESLSAPAAAVPSFSAPDLSTPGYSVPSYSAPDYSAPADSAPVYSVPDYSAPSYSVPDYSTPSYSVPDYSTPSYSAPVYSAPVYSAPVYSSPDYTAPSYSSPDVTSTFGDTSGSFSSGLSTPSFDSSSSFSSTSTPSFDSSSSSSSFSSSSFSSGD